MGLYRSMVFPFLMDVAMRDRPFTRFRKAVLNGLGGPILEIGAGTGINYVPKTPKWVGYFTIGTAVIPA